MSYLVSLDKGPLQKIYIFSYCYLNQDRFFHFDLVHKTKQSTSVANIACAGTPCLVPSFSPWEAFS